MASPLAALDALQKLETDLGDLYDLFADRFAGAGVVSALFARLAMEERSHSNRVAYQKRILKQNPTLLHGLSIDVEALRATSDAIREARERVGRMTMVDAAEAALRFETTAAEVHAHLAGQHLEPGLRSFLNRLGKDDREHRSRLEVLLDVTTMPQHATG